MNEEIKINRYSKSITFINNGIAFSQFGIAKEILDLITNLQQKVEQLENIRKETIEDIQENYNELTDYGYIDKKEIVDDLLNILNKERNQYDR